MYVSDLALWDFRSYGEVVVTLEPGVTAFVGPNGQGKTNLVEAIGYLATLSSHRVGNDVALIRAGAQRAMIQARVIRDGRPTTLDLELISGQAKRARVNRSPIPRVREILGHLHAVIFAPEDLALVKSDPQVRRRFLDELIMQTSPRFAAVRADYDRIIRQRNALLKSAGIAGRSGKSPDLRTLDIWDQKAATTGAQILAHRVNMVQALRPHLDQIYREISGGNSRIAMGYRGSLSPANGKAKADPVDSAAVTKAGAGELEDLVALESDLLVPDLTEARLLEAMALVRDQELDRGISLVGPHRDDLVLNLNGLAARTYSSHGESWSYALALRVASYRVLNDERVGGTDGEPVLILDDVFAELDGQRREYLTNVISAASQVLITAAVPHDLPDNLPGSRWDVFESQVRRVR